MTSFVRGKVRKEHAIFTYLNYFVKKNTMPDVCKIEQKLSFPKVETN